METYARVVGRMELKAALLVLEPRSTPLAPPLSVVTNRGS